MDYYELTLKTSPSPVKSKSGQWVTGLAAVGVWFGGRSGGGSYIQSPTTVRPTVAPPKPYERLMAIFVLCTSLMGMSEKLRRETRRLGDSEYDNPYVCSCVLGASLLGTSMVDFVLVSVGNNIIVWCLGDIFSHRISASKCSALLLALGIPGSCTMPQRSHKVQCKRRDEVNWLIER